MIPKYTEFKWKLEKIGRSGVFKTEKNSISIEYLQTTFNINDIHHIEPVRRKFNKEELDFELMLQRDLDDDRIKEELIPYLLRDGTLKFFPPILAVILKINPQGPEKIEKFYPVLKEHIVEDELKQAIFLEKKYGDLFSVRILKQNETLNRWYTELHLGNDASLLAIDGQHRLVALQVLMDRLPTNSVERQIYKDYIKDEYKQKFENIEVPVTIIYVPEIYEGNDVPINLLEIFRQIFVDVNKNARKVSKMRNILLNEADLLSIFTRKICSYFKKNSENDNNLLSIDVVEWEKIKLEDQITSDLAITNIIFIEDCLREFIPDDVGLKSNLNLYNIKDKLDENSDYNYEKLGLDHFSFNQKKEILDYFEEHFLKGFAYIFSSFPLAIEWNNKVKELKNSLKKSIEKNPQDDTLRNVYKVLFEGEEYQSLKKNKEIQNNLKGWLENLEEFSKDNFLNIIRTKMFQLAYIRFVLVILYPKSNKDFEEFCILFNKAVQDSNFINLWKEYFVNYKDLIEKGLKGKKTYSVANKKIEVLIEIFKFLFKEINQEKNLFKDFIDLSTLDVDKDKILNHFINEYEEKIKEVIDNDQIDKMVKDYKQKVKEFLKIDDTCE